LSKRLHVLLVEDNPDALEGMLEMTDFLGHHPQGCESAECALTLLQDKQFDVLMTDIGLPGISGLALARQARQMQPALAITIASGYACEDEMPPNVRWLMKPFGIDEYSAMLEEYSRQ
tara:strand:- start:257825 stop:258178 length:354 start_codon:yes stop_codon:yes gene_type:complete